MLITHTSLASPATAKPIPYAVFATLVPTTKAASVIVTQTKQTSTPIADELAATMMLTVPHANLG